MKSRTSRNQSQGDQMPAQELIQQRAHELYVQRGQEPGHELEDWLQAEQEIKDRQQQKSVPFRDNRLLNHRQR